MSKVHICMNCNKELANRHSLSRHKKNCKGTNRFHWYPNSTQSTSKSQPRPNDESNIIRPLQTAKPHPNPSESVSFPEFSNEGPSEESRTLQNRQEEEDRLERLEVLNGNIDYIIDQSVEEMKEEIWVIMAEFHVFEERERKGGSLASWDTLNIGRKDEDEWIEQKEDEDEWKWIEQKEDEEEEEEIFIDVTRKDAEELGELINELSQHSKFTEKTAEIKALMNSYFNDKHIKSLRTKALGDVDEILRFLGRERESSELPYKIYLLIDKIENIRQLIKRLFWIMKIENEKQKKDELSRATLNGITEQEYKTFGDELTPESISRVLKARET